MASACGGCPQSLAPDATVATLDVRPGERLIVTTPRETIRGRLLRLADDGLVLADGPAQHTVPLHDLNRVERRRDSIWNGALIGYPETGSAGDRFLRQGWDWARRLQAAV